MLARWSAISSAAQVLSHEHGDDDGVTSRATAPSAAVRAGRSPAASSTLGYDGGIAHLWRCP
jgi:hypothetical protein